MAKYWSFSFSISPSNEYSGLTFFRIDWLDLWLGIKPGFLALGAQSLSHWTTREVPSRRWWQLSLFIGAASVSGSLLFVLCIWPHHLQGWEISTEYSLEGLMLKMNLQYFGHLMGRTDSFEKTLMLGKIEGGRRRGRQRMRWLDGITDSMDMSLSREDWHATVHGVAKSWTRMSNWTTT